MANRSDEVFHFNGNHLISMPYRSMREGLLGKTLEDALQNFFLEHPEIIPGKQIDPVSEDPPHFVLLRREMPIGMWSLDHLFVDQRGILTLVETKLFQNPESRRDVIGQIIEYAANAMEFWAGGRAREKAAEFWNNRDNPKQLHESLQEEFGGELDIEVFWEQVEENLKNGRIRLIIATDELRPEVRRMIEYLNNEMQNAEVLGLELKCYGEESESLVLVPRIVGQTQSAIDNKAASKRSFKWPVEKLKAAYEDMPEPHLSEMLEKALDWAVDKGIFLKSIAKYPNFGLMGKKKGRIATFFPDGSIYLSVQDKHFLGGAAERDNLVNELKGLQLLDQDLDVREVVDGRNLSKKIVDLSKEELDKLLDIFGRYCMEE